MITFNKYQKNFTEKAIQTGYSADEINKCLTYAKPLLESGLPVIYNTSHLSAYVGYTKKYLKRASAYTEYFYKEHHIKKTSGGTRVLYEPLPNLKDIQNWIYQNILCNVKVSRYAKAYIDGRSIKDHVKFHKGKAVVITLDIKDFFGSIKLDLVNDLFLDLGYSDLVSNLLAKLCCLNDSLPQGAPTSPAISNIILRPLDDELSIYCRDQKVRYTRYADDLAFSGESIDQKELIELISSFLSKLGPILKLNTDKTFVMRSNQRQIISGIVVNEKIQVPRKKRDVLRQAFYYIDKYGLEDHLQMIDCTKSNYLKHLLGIANYITHINPEDKKTQYIKERLYTMIEENK